MQTPLSSKEEEIVNYGEEEENLPNNALEEGKGSPPVAVVGEGVDTQPSKSTQVQPFDPYGFD